MSLTLQMSAGDDKNAVWVLRLKSEGVNQISNGAFDDATGWTQTGDWSITGGEATYTFSANASGDLTITTAAVSAVAFILEYEVTTVTQDGFTLSLEGTGSFVSTVEVFLPITLGQHRVIISGKASSTVFRLKARGFAGGDVLKIDNLKFRVLEETTYLATQDLTLDNTYDGQVLELNDRLSNIDEFMDVQSSGSIGGVSSYTFTAARYTSNTKFDGFFEEFYPAFDGGTLISRDCEIGVVWNTASTDTEITWLMRGRIVDYRYEPRKLIITILQSTEIDTRPVPFYTVQKDFDNEVSYFIKAPDENYGLTIPIVYGARSTWLPLVWDFKLSPCVLVDKEKMTFMICSHKVSATSTGTTGTHSKTLTGSNVFKYIDGLDTYMACYKPSGNGSANSNTDIRSTISMFDSISAGNNLLGWIETRLTTPSSYSDVVQENMLNLDTTDFVEIDSSEVVAAKLAGSVSTSDAGYLSLAAADVSIGFLTRSNETSPAGDRLYEVGFNNLTLSTPPNLSITNDTFTGGITAANLEHEFGANSTNKKEASFPWTIEEVTNLDFFIENDDVNAGDVLRVQYGSVHLFNIEVVAFLKKLPAGVMQGASMAAASQAGFVRHIIEKYSGRKPPEPERLDRSAVDNSFVRVDGREYGRWIDFATSAGGTRDANNGAANDPGFAEDALIETPTYIKESFFRDEFWVERDLQITSTADTTHFVCAEVISREDDYYNNAELYNATTETKTYITDYVGSTNTFTIAAADGAMAADDNIYLTNIQGDNRIDLFSFDTVGNETNGTRSANAGWKFANTLLFKSPINELINILCFESHCQIFETADEDAGHSKIKIVALDAATSGDTWSKPAFIRGVEAPRTSLTPLANIFTSFRLSYAFEVGNGDYRQEIFVDKSGFSSPASTLVIADQLLCKKAEQVYRVTKPFVYSSNWIYDDTTAELFLQKKIEWFTKQRLIVDWTTGLSDGAIDYIKYERGDQVKLNYSQSIPTGLNNSSFFMITNKRIITVQGAPLIQWRLIEMG